jgi:hypothetical protein
MRIEVALRQQKQPARLVDGKSTELIASSSWIFIVNCVPIQTNMRGRQAWID